MGTYRQWAVDIVVAVAVTAMVVASIKLTPAPLSTPGSALLVASSLSLVLWRRFPVAIVLLTGACAITVFILDRPEIPVEVPLLFALYSAIRSGHRVLGIGAAVTHVLTMVIFGVFIPEGRSAREDTLVLLLGWFIAAVVLGETARLREKRAADQARNHEETLRRRASEERLRIARELHDSLTHSISVIKVQAGVAVHLARKRGEEVPEALLAIQEASTDAVRELRETLSVLRGEPDISGLDRLDDLVGRARSTGLPVRLTISGRQRPLPAEIDCAAYRIVQEALTNVTRHAGAATANVQLEFRKRLLTVQIDDDGTATAATPPVPGVGLIGMRERITALGGSLSAAPRQTGGFRVRAELPVG